MKKILSLLLFGMGFTVAAMAQNEQPAPEQAAPTVAKPKFTKATFKSTRIINMQSVEIVSKGNLQFMITHHFSNLWNKDAGSQNLAQVFGLNSGVAHTYLSFDYSPTSFLNLGLAAAGNSRFEGWAKIKLLRQQTGLRNIPVSVVWYSMVNADASKKTDPSSLTWNKFNYLHQILIARKFTDRLSLQLMPSMVHYNIVPYGKNNNNNVFSLGIGGKYKLNSKKALTFEYSRQLNAYENVMDKNANILNYNPDLLSLGMEFDTGGHVFQFFLGTTTVSSNIEQLSRNTNSLKDLQFALGFNLNRSFNLRN